MSPDAIAVRAFLARASRRLTWIAVFEGAAAGLAIALVVALAAASAQWRSASSDHTLVISLSLAALGIAIGAAFVLMRPRRVARLVERHAPQCRNVVVTAAELIDQPMRVRPYIRDLVCREAARAVEPLDPAALFPARRAMISLGVTVVLWAAVLLFIVVHPTGSSALRSEPGSILSAVINGVEVTITPPAYAQSPTRPLAHSPTRPQRCAIRRALLPSPAAASGSRSAPMPVRSRSRPSATFGRSIVANHAHSPAR